MDEILENTVKQANEKWASNGITLKLEKGLNNYRIHYNIGYPSDWMNYNEMMKWLKDYWL
jgi:hypothetical protein